MLRPETGTFDTPDYADVYARQKWFYQAQIESPAMFARTPGAGSLYWLCTRDASGAYLDGGGSYTLDVPQPEMPAKLFWSITVYDARTRSGSAPTRTRPRSGPCLNSPIPRLTRRSGSTSALSRLRTAGRKAAGSRPCPVSAGSSTSGSTAPKDPPSTAPGTSPTSRPPVSQGATMGKAIGASLPLAVGISAHSARCRSSRSC